MHYKPMKDFDQQVPQDNKVITAEQQVREKKHIATSKLHSGHTMWEFDLTTGLIEPAKIENTTAVPAAYKQMAIVSQVKQRPNCLYAGALNRKNAVKKLIPMYESLVASGQIVRPINEKLDANI